MATDSRGRLALLAVLVVVLAAVVWWELGVSTPTAPVSPTSASAAGGAKRRPAPGASPTGAVEQVALTRLGAAKEAVVEGDRDPFRFKPRVAPPPPPPPPGPGGVAGPGGALGGPGRPAAPEPIPLRFIGIVSQPEQRQKLAVLSDGRGVFYGREGDIISGRYRIVRIGVESIEMAHLDGHGQQTIRLSGS